MSKSPAIKIDDVLAVGFDLPPHEAIALFEKRFPAVSWSWKDLADDAHQKAFTVARTAGADVLGDIHSSLQKALAEGTPFQTWRKSIEPTLKAKGWWGKQQIVNPTTGAVEKVQLGSPWRLETIYRTNMQTSLQSGRYKQQLELAERFPFWQYLAVGDGRGRPAHATMHLRVYRADDAAWSKWYPPNGFNCRCRVRNMRADAVERAGLKVLKSSDTEFLPDKGFGRAPGAAHVADVKKFPADLASAYKKSIDAGPPPKAAARVAFTREQLEAARQTLGVQKGPSVEDLLTYAATGHPGALQGLAKLEKIAAKTAGMKPPPTVKVPKAAKPIAPPKPAPVKAPAPVPVAKAPLPATPKPVVAPKPPAAAAAPPAPTVKPAKGKKAPAKPTSIYQGSLAPHTADDAWIEWNKSLTPSERKAMIDWTKNGYTNVRLHQSESYRTYFAKTKGWALDSAEMAKEMEKGRKILLGMNKAMSKAPGWQRNAYRGLNAVPQDVLDEYAHAYKTGKPIVMDTHASATIDRAVAESFAEGDPATGGKVNIIIKMEQKSGVWLGSDDVSDVSTELEILLREGTRFKVTDVSKDANGLVLVTMKEID